MADGRRRVPLLACPAVWLGAYALQFDPQTIVLIGNFVLALGREQLSNLHGWASQ